MREFLRGGYQALDHPVVLTTFGKVTGVYVPIQLKPGERLVYHPADPSNWYVVSED